ncbi:MAG: hypothetical protein IKO75_10160 [Bacteroidales bacterium]|nr:hypothetical protein [Bacteroidales bacterium]
MLHINSPEETISASPEKVYQVLTRFFERPVEDIPGLSNWESFADGCRFTVSDHITCRLTLREQQPNSHVAYHAEVESPHVTATAAFDIVPQGSESSLQAKIDADVPFLLQGMIKGVVNQFMGTAMKYLKKAIENS